MGRKKLLFNMLCLIFSGSIANVVFGDGALTVRTEPEGIEVWLDNNFVGDSPIIEKKLKSGRYTLKLVDPVQRSSTIEEIFIQENETTIIEKTIKSKFGSLKINSDPEGAKVYLFTELGTTPLSNDFMNPGKYRLELRHPNSKYHLVSEDIVIPRGETVSLSKALQFEEEEVVKKKIWDKKALLRVALGAGTAAGYIFSIVEYGMFKKYNEQYETVKLDSLKKSADDSKLWSILGIVGGSLCLVGLEIVAFF